MKLSKKLSIGEFAAIIASKLESKGISVVLTGGAVVSIYTDNKYMSHDADFISANDSHLIATAMLELGFKKHGKDFRHPDTDFFVEFPTGPLAVGNLQIKASGHLEFHGHKLTLLSPTESVMDRLAGYFHWNDLQNLDQAIWITEKHPVNLSKVKNWANKEGALEKFEVFKMKMREKK